MQKSMQTWSRVSVAVQTKHKNGEEKCFSDFSHEMTDGARWGGFSVYRLFREFTENGAKTKKVQAPI